MPSTEQLSAMGMTSSQAQQYLTNKQLQAAAKGTPGSTPAAIPALGTDAWYAYIVGQADSAGQSVTDYLRQHRSDLGITEGMISEYSRDAERWSREHTEEEVRTKSFNDSEFKQFCGTVVAYAQQGMGDRIVSYLDYNWAALSEEQRRRVNELLSAYGATYQP